MLQMFYKSNYSLSLTVSYAYFFNFKSMQKARKKKKRKEMVFIKSINHGRIIKWTQHIGFLTLAEMARIVERNHGND